MKLLSKLAVVAPLAAFAVIAGAQANLSPEAADAQQNTNATKSAFKRADANGDGKLSRDEAVSLPAVAEKFTQIDKNGDGVIGSDEFEAGIVSPQPTTK